MKIDADGTVSESGAGGDFWAGHTLDEAEDQGFAIGLGESEEGVERGVSFGGGMRWGRICGRERAGVCADGFFDKFVVRFAAAMKIGGAIAGDGGEPTGELGNFAKGRQARESLEEDVLEEVVDVGVRDAGEKDAVDHASIARVEETEGRAIALLGGADDGVVGGIRRRVHGVLTEE